MDSTSTMCPHAVPLSPIHAPHARPHSVDPSTRSHLRAILSTLPNTGEYAPLRRKLTTIIKLAKKVERLEREANKAEREAEAAQQLLEVTRAEVRQKEEELASLENTEQAESSAMGAERARARREYAQGY